MAEESLDMAENIHSNIAKVVYSSEVENSLRRHKNNNREFFKRIEKQIMKIIREPNIGKPLRYTLKNRRRVHIGSFVLVYEFYQNELRFIDFDHHNKIYKKFL